MVLQYSEAWNTEEKGLNLSGLYALAFSKEGTWLACSNSDCTFVLATDSGKLEARIWYPEKICMLLWLTGQVGSLLCVYTDGTVVNTSLANPVSS